MPRLMTMLERGTPDIALNTEDDNNIPRGALHMTTGQDHLRELNVKLKLQPPPQVLVHTSNTHIYYVHTGYYGSIPKEKQGQENQPKTTHQVASQQAGHVTQLGDLDSGETCVYVEIASSRERKERDPEGLWLQGGKKKQNSGSAQNINNNNKTKTIYSSC
ncbi:hypothetical protein BgiMline_033572 [Biomphalaria glabrata]|nr:hypothetical protein BgiMline_024660 [Biomphalaria glabrata]